MKRRKKFLYLVLRGRLDIPIFNVEQQTHVAVQKTQIVNSKTTLVFTKAHFVNSKYLYVVKI